MREKLCNKDRLIEYLGFNKEFIEEDKEDVAKLKEDIKNNVSRFRVSNEKVISRTYRMIKGYYLENIQCRYSLGEPVENIYDDYKQAVYCLSQTDETIGYTDLLWLISIGIMLETEKQDFEILYESVKKNHYENDYIIQYLLSAVGIIDQVDSFDFSEKSPYIHMKKIIETAQSSKTDAARMLEDYTKKQWLDGHKEYGWHKFHKDKYYKGLWSFESGAVAKILGLEDEDIKDCNHYPYDLRHHKNSMEFQEISMDAKEPKEPEKAKGKYSPVIPDQYYGEIIELIKDYEEMNDKEFYQKYEGFLKGMWFTEEEYETENKERDMKGMLTVNYLVEKEVILQLDYKEDIEDYIDTLESPWEREKVKLVNFDLDNDQNYYMYVLEEAPLQLYEVKIETLNK